MTWRICDKWDLNVDLEQAEATSGHRPFHEFPFDSMGRRAICREALIGGMEPLRSAAELFAGLGISSTILRGVHPTIESHWLSEINPDLVRHLQANGFGQAVASDALEQIYYLGPYDLIDCDFGLFTIRQWRKQTALQEFSTALFEQKPKYVIHTDESIARLGVNRQHYSVDLGVDVMTIEDYVNGWSMLWHGLYGYSVIQAEYHRGATYTLWQEVPHRHVVPRKTQADYVGVAFA